MNSLSERILNELIAKGKDDKMTTSFMQIALNLAAKPISVRNECINLGFGTNNRTIHF